MTTSCYLIPAEKYKVQSADLRVLTSHNLLNAAVAQSDDLADIAVAESSGVGFADRSVTGLPGCLMLA